MEKKNLKRGTNKYFFKRYLKKKNYEFTVSEFKDRNKFELLEPVNVEGLDFFLLMWSLRELDQRK